MCLVAFALDTHSRFPFVLAANRDEWMDRPTARLAWWDSPGMPAILGGRDLKAGGTWLGLTAQGRLGLVTNYRDPPAEDPSAPSRGEIVSLWLKGDRPMHRLWPQLAMNGYNGFNLVALDFAQGECTWVSNRARYPQRLERGVHVLSNGLLGDPWPKSLQLKSRLKQALSISHDREELTNQLFDALADSRHAEDDALPRTGVPYEWEKVLSSAFVRTPDGRYGTRSSTLVITERVNKRLVTHVMERTYTQAGTRMALLRQVDLRNWPPRYTASAEQLARLDQTLPPSAMRQEDRFESSEVLEQADHHLSPTVPRKTRARKLIKSTR